MDREQWRDLLRTELEGTQDRMERGQWTADHCLRTASLALELRRAVGAPQALDDLLYFSGLFHDISHDAVAHEIHAQVGAKRVRQLFAGVLPPQFLEQAAEIIAVHDDRQPREDGRGIALHLVQDADMLDHFGTLQIWAQFGYAARHLEPLQSALQKLWKSQQKREHYLELLHFPASRAEMVRRMTFARRFLQQACWEGEGLLGEKEGRS